MARLTLDPPLSTATASGFAQHLHLKNASVTISSAQHRLEVGQRLDRLECVLPANSCTKESLLAVRQKRSRSVRPCQVL